MSIRQFIAFLLLINYLLVVGAGCVNRPEDQRERLLVQTFDDNQHYQQCRYLRMDGLETFLADALASRYQNNTKTTPQHLFFVVNGVDAHHLPRFTWLLPAVATGPENRLAVAYTPVVAVGINRPLYTPPWLG